MSKETVREDIQTPASSQSTLELILRCGSSSLAWRWFGFERSNVSQKTPICKLCRKTVAVKGSSTSNLFHHLRTTHHSEYENYEKLRESESAEHDAPAGEGKKAHESFSKKVPYDRKHERWQGITNAVTNYIARDKVPFQAVVRDGFKQLLKTLDPRYTLPGRKYFSETALPKLYESCRQTIAHEVQKVLHFATTTDLWPSRTSEPYLSLTAHFIDETWQL